MCVCVTLLVARAECRRRAEQTLCWRLTSWFNDPEMSCIHNLSALFSAVWSQGVCGMHNSSMVGSVCVCVCVCVYEKDWAPARTVLQHETSPAKLEAVLSVWMKFLHALGGKRGYAKNTHCPSLDALPPPPPSPVLLPLSAYFLLSSWSCQSSGVVWTGGCGPAWVLIPHPTPTSFPVPCNDTVSVDVKRHRTERYTLPVKLDTSGGRPASQFYMQTESGGREGRGVHASREHMHVHSERVVLYVCVCMCMRAQQAHGTGT